MTGNDNANVTKLYVESLVVRVLIICVHTTDGYRDGYKKAYPISNEKHEGKVAKARFFSRSGSCDLYIMQKVT